MPQNHSNERSLLILNKSAVTGREEQSLIKHVMLLHHLRDIATNLDSAYARSYNGLHQVSAGL